MNHNVKVVEGYTAYDDVEFGPGGHHWTRAECSCPWKGPQRTDRRLPKREKDKAKADAFDHLQEIHLQ